MKQGNTKNNRIKAFITAAQLLDNSRSDFACIALETAVKKVLGLEPSGVILNEDDWIALSDMRRQCGRAFAEMFKPDNKDATHAWFGDQRVAENREQRILALLFMAEIERSTPTRRPRGEKVWAVTVNVGAEE